jgi:hypothetical protein
MEASKHTWKGYLSGIYTKHQAVVYSCDAVHGTAQPKPHVCRMQVYYTTMQVTCIYTWLQHPAATNVVVNCRAFSTHYLHKSNLSSVTNTSSLPALRGLRSLEALNSTEQLAKSAFDFVVRLGLGRLDAVCNCRSTLRLLLALPAVHTLSHQPQSMIMDTPIGGCNFLWPH